MAVSVYVLVNISGPQTNDLIAFVEGQSQAEIGELVISKIRKTQGVTNTIACFAAA